MYEKIGILAALAARSSTETLGSATVGERVAQLARACEAWEKKANEMKRATTADRDTAAPEMAEVKRIAAACKLESYVENNGDLYVGRPHYYVRMGGSR